MKKLKYINRTKHAQCAHLQNIKRLIEKEKVKDFPRLASSLIYLKGKEAEKEDTVKNCQKTSDTDIKSQIIMSINMAW